MSTVPPWLAVNEQMTNIHYPPLHPQNAPSLGALSLQTFQRSVLVSACLNISLWSIFHLNQNTLVLFNIKKPFLP